MSPGAPHVLSQAIFGLGPVLTDFLPDSFRAVAALPKMGGREGLHDFSRGGLSKNTWTVSGQHAAKSR